MPIPIEMIRDACSAIQNKECEQCPSGRECRCMAERVARAVLFGLSIRNASTTMNAVINLMLDCYPDDWLEQMDESHWTNRMKPTSTCLVCGKQLNDRRRHYCSRECYESGRREYYRKYKRTYRNTNPEVKERREYRQSPEAKARRRLVENARQEAKERGMDIRDVLEMWGADAGRAGQIHRQKAGQI